MPGQQVGGWPPRECPECRKLFEPNRANQLFCTSQHNADWNNRATARGRVLTPFSIVARTTRNGTRGTPEARDIGKKATSRHNALIQQYRDEDRAAGRMEWAEYMIHRVRLGLETR
ncbi:hypothetical protein S2M10_07110 [Sphingomonas sp. S2M10]|uniref:hypothetical protein n=1 Tax=Sphingomonas sp. S2M10 TaxID=2705010 RepID=UPI001456F7F0|nr:hypothetical protein [Sphingomonas sp. S2M10]NLS25741.1 hypothetical protein [Sphingomonas sp. S2M10]